MWLFLSQGEQGLGDSRTPWVRCPRAREMEFDPGGGGRGEVETPPFPALLLFIAGLSIPASLSLCIAPPLPSAYLGYIPSLPSLISRTRHFRFSTKMAPFYKK